jgi:predicted MFS family arabinose efflux permease
LLGGQLVVLWGWPAVFFFRVPLACISAVLTLALLRQPAAVAANQRFDTLGAATLTTTIAGVLLALNYGNRFGWLSWPTLALGVGVCACLVVCIRHELRCPEPVIDLRLFQHPAFTIANIAYVLVNAAGFTVLLLVPYYLLTYYKASASWGGVLLAMSPFGTMLASPLGGWLLARLSSYLLSVCGIGLVAAGLWGVSQWPLDASPSLVVVTLLVHGYGMGLFQIANMDFVMGSIPRQQQGVAGSLAMLTRTMGVVSGATLGSLVFGLLQPRYTSQLQAAGVAGDTLSTQAFLLAFRQTFWWAAALAALACVLMGGHRWRGCRGPRQRA